MNYNLRLFIVDRCKPSDQFVVTAKHKKEYPLTLNRKPLSFGITPEGFLFFVSESRNFGSIIVGDSLWEDKPQSRIRNDTDPDILLNTLQERMFTAQRMAKQLC